MILIHVAIMPNAYGAVIGYLFFISIIVSFVGRLIDKPIILLISNGCAAFFTIMLFFGLLIPKWL